MTENDCLSTLSVEELTEVSGGWTAANTVDLAVAVGCIGLGCLGPGGMVIGSIISVGYTIGRGL